ncbi:MAG: ADP-ribosylation factor-like protein [Deltaproteobacteria bacterium]
MAIINHAKKEINAKIVYFGHEGVGKGTSLRYIYGRIKPSLRGELKALATGGSSLLFFDFTPFEQPLANGYRTRFQIYTLNGTVSNPAAWKMTLKGTDGLMFVAEAAHEKLAEIENSVMQLRDILNSYGVPLDDIPLVLQLNKVDQTGFVQQDEAASLLRLVKADVRLTTATTGEGVLEALSLLSRKMMTRIGDFPALQRAGKEATVFSLASDTSEDRNLSDVPGLKQSEPDSVLAMLQMHDDGEIDVETSASATSTVQVVTDRVSAGCGSVRIPLEIKGPGGIERLTVTVTIEPG